MQLMVVDDRHLILGSANLNDRSMLGSRDSELAVYVTGPLDNQVPIGQESWPVSSRIHQFRRSLFFEHFGHDIAFPAAPEAWQAIKQILTTNTDFYNRAFKTYPSNEYRSFQALQSRNKDFDQQFFEAQRTSVRGHAVCYPYYFLHDENLMGAKNSELGLMVLPIYALF